MREKLCSVTFCASELKTQGSSYSPPCFTLQESGPSLTLTAPFVCLRAITNVDHWLHPTRAPPLWSRSSQRGGGVGGGFTPTRPRGGRA